MCLIAKPSMNRFNNATGTRNGELPSSWFEPSIHSAYFQIFTKLLAAHHLPLPRPFTGQPRLLPLLDFLPSIELFHALKTPEAGIEVGLAVPGAAHGAMGLVALSSDTLWDAMVTMVRYGPIRNHLFNYRCLQQADMAVLEVRPRLNLARYERFLMYSTVLAIFNVFKAISEDVAFNVIRLTFPWETPSCLENSSIPATVFDFNRESLSLQIPMEVAMQPSQTADPDLCMRLKMAGEEELSKLSGSTGARVRHLLHQRTPAWPSLQEVADKLAMSKRTLIRKLESEELSYQLLLDEARGELACWFLRRSDLPLREIAERTGFSDQANFTRSFRRMQGCAPSEYRSNFRRILDLD